MNTTIILAIVAIIAVIGAVTSSIPIHQASAQGISRGPPPFEPPNQHAAGACDHTANTPHHPPFCHVEDV
jgi:hypothetical protein